MAAVTIHSDFGTQENKICWCLCFSPSICHEVMGQDDMILVFWMLSFKSAFLLSSFTLTKRLFSFSLLYAIRVGVIFIPEVIDISPSNLDSSLWFIQPSISHDVLTCNLNKQGDNIQPQCIPFPILNQSVVPCPVLTVEDPVFPTASPSHQEACTSLLSSTISGETEWKPQSQKTILCPSANIFKIQFWFASQKTKKYLSRK